MSFATERPFFLYREPADQRMGVAGSGGRSLRIFFLAKERVTGDMGEGRTVEHWANRTVWADSLPENDRLAVANSTALTPGDIPAASWMTTFEDYSAPRPGTDDVYFSRSTDQSPKLPPPVHYETDRRVSVPVEPILAGIATWCVLMWRRRRTPKASVSTSL